MYFHFKILIRWLTFGQLGRTKGDQVQQCGLSLGSQSSPTSPSLSHHRSLIPGHPFSTVCGDGGTKVLVVGLNTEQGLSWHFVSWSEREFLPWPTRCSAGVALFLSSPGNLSIVIRLLEKYTLGGREPSSAPVIREMDFAGCALESGMPWAGCCGWQGNPMQIKHPRQGWSRGAPAGCSSDRTPPVWGDSSPEMLSLKA